MKKLIVSIIFGLALFFVFGQTFSASEAEQMKFDLIGKTMGGRDKGWKFQSSEQIKELVINDKMEEPQRRVYSITLKLQDPRVPGVYKAEALVTYERTEAKWEIKVVGLKSLVRME